MISELSLKGVNGIMGVKKSEWQLPTVDDRPRMLESLENELMVTGTDSNTKKVAQVPKHGHEGKLLIFYKFLPD